MEDLISELQRLQSHLDELRMESCFNKSKGLSDQLYNSLKKMKIGSVRKVCIICHCFYQRGEVIIQTPCRHIFHNRCIEPWLKKSITCPICRSNLKELLYFCLLYTSPSPRDRQKSRMPSSA
eukprot:TRINITY_DN32149_c0_g1_i1.p2 TRINITY_DN32149_c0_g1~~TRINITY_DN32149_c0_g1_i1.p2  ORF type:complete len:122 (+),score=11.68 TRINITY_DN32149_c0_g1_i1:124-489(+)